MSEPTQQPNEGEHAEEAVEASEQAVQTPEADESTETPDVEAQLAEATTRGDALAELLLTRSIEQGAGDVLQDVTDLPRTDDLLGEDGTPDLTKIRAAAQALSETKPHLAKAKYGDVGQGAKHTANVPTWSDIMCEALG